MEKTATVQTEKLSHEDTTDCVSEYFRAIGKVNLQNDAVVNLYNTLIDD